MDDMLSVSGHVKGIPVEASILAVCLPIMSWVWRPNLPLPECGIHHGSEEEVPQDTVLASTHALLPALATMRVYLLQAVAAYLRASRYLRAAGN
jgi:hypothetical protein